MAKLNGKYVLFSPQFLSTGGDVYAEEDNYFTGDNTFSGAVAFDSEIALPPEIYADGSIGSNGQVLTKTANGYEWKTPSNGLPSVTASDNGKVLRVVNGAWAAASLPVYDGSVE